MPVKPAEPTGTGKEPTESGFIDPKALMSIKDLELRARVVVQGFWTGIHRSPYHGFSVEFTEYRQYSPGDDPRYLDWRLYARSDRFYIKKFEDETNLRCHLLVDHSRSMQFGSGSCSKSAYAQTLAATLGYFLFKQGDAVGLLTFDETIRDYLPARNRSGHLRQIMLALEKPALGKRTRLEPPLKRILEIVNKRGLMVLISDLLVPLEGFQKTLAALPARGHEVIVFHVLDPAELNFDFSSPVLFNDLETGRDLYIDPGLARQDYLKKFQAHTAAIQALCQKHGIGYFQTPSDRPLELALFDFMRERTQRPAMRVLRKGNSG